MIFIITSQIAIFVTLFIVYLYLAIHERQRFFGITCVAWLLLVIEGIILLAVQSAVQSPFPMLLSSLFALVIASSLLGGFAEFVERPLPIWWFYMVGSLLLIQLFASGLNSRPLQNIITVSLLLIVYTTTFYLLYGAYSPTSSRSYIFLTFTICLYGIAQMGVSFYREHFILEVVTLMALTATAVGLFMAYFERLHSFLQDKEQQLRISEEKFSKSFFASPMATVVSRVRDRCYIEVNDKFLQLSGYTREEVIGQTAATLSIFYYEEEERAIGQALTEHGRASSMEVTYQRKSGKLGICLISVEIISVAGEPCFLSIVEDITERRQVEAALLRTQKLESLGILAGGIAHDFNNLLVAILGQTSLAVRKLDNGSSAKLHIEKAISAAEKAAALTGQLLAYAGQGTIEFQPINLNKLIGENLHLFQVVMPQNVELVLDLSAIPYVEGDKNQIQQVVMNLLINGAEALEGHSGTVTIETGVCEQSEGAGQEIWLANGTQLRPGHYVRLKVSDTGIGMDTATLGKIFDPFFSTKFTGRGLGLAAALGIVQSHHGGLQVESVEQEGTTFSLYLPVYE